MIFPYRKTSGRKYGPIAPIALKGVHRWVPFYVFVDSGADYSIFHSDVALLLGRKLTSGKKKVVTVGDGDEMTVFLHTVEVCFANYYFKAEMAFSPGLGSGFNLIGRKTFFEKFQICFNDRTKVLRVTKL